MHIHSELFWMILYFSNHILIMSHALIFTGSVMKMWTSYWKKQCIALEENGWLQSTHLSGPITFSTDHIWIRNYRGQTSPKFISFFFFFFLSNRRAITNGEILKRVINMYIISCYQYTHHRSFCSNLQFCYKHFIVDHMVLAYSYGI